MGGSKNIQSRGPEPHEGQSDVSGSFFKKYELLVTDEHATNSESIFKKYAPVRSDCSETGIQPSGEVFDLAVSNSGPPIAKRAKRRASKKMLWAAAATLLILSVWMTVKIVLIGQDRRAASVNPSSAPETPAAASDDGRPGEPSHTDPLFSVQGSFSEEKNGDAAKSAQSHRLAAPSELIHSTMLARAREFEDRGMLLRAEEEYRAVSVSFPGDKLSQAGISRVQGVLFARREDEESRVSRENGLRSFRIGDYAGAERELSAAVNAGRGDTASFYALGMSYLKLGNHSMAKLMLNKCLAVSPNYAPALVGLAEATAATGNRDQALTLLQRALELGGGAEYTPARIKDAMTSLDPSRAVSRPVSPPPSVARSQPAFFSRVSHSHDLILASCKGYLEVINSVVHFNAGNPDHSFHVLASEVSGARMAGDSLEFRIGGKVYRFRLQERPAKDFLDALKR